MRTTKTLVQLGQIALLWAYAGPLAVVAWAGNSSWTFDNSGTTNNLYAATYGNGTFVVAGAGGTILSSPDAIHWGRVHVAGGDLHGIAWGSNEFVAVGDGGAILTSPDAVQWNPQSSGTTQDLSAICFGNNLFVAVGAGGSVLTSPDAENWTSQSSGTNAPLLGVAIGNRTFVAVGGTPLGGSAIVTSSDGTNWSAVSGVSGQGSHIGLNSILYAGNTFVAVGAQGGVDTITGAVMTSPDGVTWASQITGPGGALYGVAQGNGQFVATGVPGSLFAPNPSGFVLTSPDAVSWTLQNLATNAGFYSVTFGNGSFVAAGKNGALFQSGVVPPILGPVLLQSNGWALVQVTSQAGQSYSIQASKDLHGWETITNVVLTNATAQFTDPAATNFPWRFYRATFP